MALAKARRCFLVLFVAAALAGCAEGKGPFGFAARASGTSADSSGAATRLVERDVEAPEVFQMADEGLWDGRMSLGTIWVAHFKAKDPERVIIRNESNGKFVIGALFRRERDVPGPKFQVSSDAAEALGMKPGEPARLHVTALRRAEVPEAPASPEAPVAPPAPEVPVPGSATLSTSEASAPLAPKASGKLDAPYIQVGLFSRQENAAKAAREMRAAGLTPEVKKRAVSGKEFWQVIVGPAQSAAERAKGLTKVKALGYSDAYAVKG